MYRESVSVAGGGVLVREERKVRLQRWANGDLNPDSATSLTHLASTPSSMPCIWSLTFLEPHLPSSVKQE